MQSVLPLSSPSLRSLADLQRSLDPLRERLVSHPVYTALSDLEDVRQFMGHHVFAVWDFMSLLKGLQRELTCVELPWTPRGDATARRLINEIVVAEESDTGLGGVGYASHFELYLAAMRQCGADTERVEDFVLRLQCGETVPSALATGRAPLAARRFVGETWRLIEAHSLPSVAAAFTVGREDVIPDMFMRFVADLSIHHAGRLSNWIDYLERHIQLDGERHGPMAARMLEAICGDDERAWARAHAGAVSAIEARIELWTGIVEAIEARRR